MSADGGKRTAGEMRQQRAGVRPQRCQDHLPVIKPAEQRSVLTFPEGSLPSDATETLCAASSAFPFQASPLCCCPPPKPGGPHIPAASPLGPSSAQRLCSWLSLGPPGTEPRPQTSSVSAHGRFSGRASVKRAPVTGKAVLGAAAVAAAGEAGSEVPNKTGKSLLTS